MKENGLEFKVGLVFRGTPEEFEGLMRNIKAMRLEGIMIDTVPLPEHPAKGLMIDTVPLPEMDWEDACIGYAQDPRTGAEGVFIGTWPTPTGNLGKPGLKKLAERMQQVKILDDIHGGMRQAHFHLGDAIVLLDRDGLNEFVRNIVRELSEQL